ncbi:MAG: hypothetical protein J6386_17075 [Candidatus Synoicihabitans palmerolidicus]|nr:hypothetical protein [Candidatus Synoicihabitans palmerolidicus]MCC5024389.1 hypothetical protein [Candidatus Synoicihabitans palmerolidicus]
MVADHIGLRALATAGVYAPAHVEEADVTKAQCPGEAAVQDVVDDKILEDEVRGAALVGLPVVAVIDLDPALPGSVELRRALFLPRQRTILRRERR